MGRFYTEVQNDEARGAEYHTLTLEGAASKYKKGFITVLEYEHTTVLEGYNTVEEYEDMLGVEPGSYAEMDLLDVGDSTRLEDGLCTRIW